MILVRTHGADALMEWRDMTLEAVRSIMLKRLESNPRVTGFDLLEVRPVRTESFWRPE